MSPILCRHIRPLLAQSNKRWLGVRLSSSAAKHHEPLRVLFCGADAFSIYSLRALHKLQQANPEKIASIDVSDNGALIGWNLFCCLLSTV